MTLLNAKAASKYISSSIVIGIVLGVICAVIANLFRNGIVLLSEWEVSLFPTLPSFFFYIIALTLSAIIVHFIKKQLNTSAFHGVADSIYFAHKSTDSTDIKAGMLSTFAAFVSASGGASVGQYGPLVHFGTTIGALLKRYLRLQLSSDLFIGAGVAASISAGFGAPLAGVIFAHEVVLRHYSHKSILAIATASGVAYALTQYFWEKSMVFDFPQYDFDLLNVITISLISGPIYGLIAILYMKNLLFFSKLSQQINFRPVYKTFVGIVALSLLGAMLPDVMGLGTQTVLNIFATEYGLSMLILILVAKIFATSISLNFGFFGGVFSPALLIGASAGAIVSSLLMHAGIILNFEYALVICGMAAVTGSVIGAPITMIILVIELTGSYVYGLAALVSIAVSVSFTQIRFGASYFDIQLDRRNINISEGRLGLYLSETLALNFCQKNFGTINSNDSVGTAQKMMSKHQCAELIVISENHEFVGKIDAIAILNRDPAEKLLEYVDKECIRIFDTYSLSDAMKIASNFVGEFIPVVNARENMVVGVISENALFSAYLDEQRKIIEMEKQ
jgi:CIC family chloride channel protein